MSEHHPPKGIPRYWGRHNTYLKLLHISMLTNVIPQQSSKSSEMHNHVINDA